MSLKYQQLAVTPAVRAAQTHYYGAARTLGDGASADRFGAEEIEFVTARDSFYMATVSETGWPYMQHRGGPAGFLRVLKDGAGLAFADLGGNRQLLSTGNLAANDRVALFLMDYPNGYRLKINGHARIVDAHDEPDVARELGAGYEPGARVERLFKIDVVSYDWNCSQHITPRFTAAEIESAVAGPLRARIAELERLLNQSPS